MAAASLRHSVVCLTRLFAALPGERVEARHAVVRGGPPLGHEALERGIKGPCCLRMADMQRDLRHHTDTSRVFACRAAAVASGLNAPEEHDRRVPPPRTGLSAQPGRHDDGAAACSFQRSAWPPAAPD
jgi:hypothetical protein